MFDLKAVKIKDEEAEMISQKQELMSLMISQMQKVSSVRTKWRLLELQFGIKIQ